MVKPHFVATVLALSLASGAAAQYDEAVSTFTLTFEDIPVGTRAEDLQIPGLVFARIKPHFLDPPGTETLTESGWVVEDLSSLSAHLPPGFAFQHASGKALVKRHDSGDFFDPGVQVAPVEMAWPGARHLLSFRAVLGGIGCWGGAGGPSYWTFQPCSWYSTGSGPYGLDPVESYETLVQHDERSPGTIWANKSYVWRALSYGYQPRPGYGRFTYIDNLTVSYRTTYRYPATCSFGEPLTLVPPDGAATEWPSFVEAGQPVTFAWKPVLWAPQATSASIRANTLEQVGENIDPSTRWYSPTLSRDATTLTIQPRRTGRGDWILRVTIAAIQQCGASMFVLNYPEYSGRELYIRDRPAALRVDSIYPPVAPPGSTIVIRGAGFVGSDSAAATQGAALPEPATTGWEFQPQTTDGYLPPGTIRVLIKGVDAATTVVDTETIRVVVPELLNGPADIEIRTAYDQIAVPASNGLTVGPAPPKRRSAG